MIDAEAIRKFVFDEEGEGKARVADGESLFDSGFLDSLKLLMLIAFLEKEFGIKIKQRDLVIENFDTIERISRLIGDYKKEG